MTITVPDSAWYKKKSLAAKAPLSCPYANVHKCHRYYTSIYMLGKANMITSIDDAKKSELDEFWNKSGLLPVIEENDTGVASSDGRTSTFTNFCPEVSNEYLGYYANFLARYVDEIDKDSGHRTAARENIKNDWRYEWGWVKACHFLDCKVYSQVHSFNSKGIGKFDQLAHANVLILIGRMEQCLENGDPSGVLHAAASILETTAKDIIGSDKIANEPLGGFIDKYKNTSALPKEIKDAVGVIYKLRNTETLAGHGGTGTPNITIQDAILIAAATKFVVEVEYRARKI